jgi:succinate-semialdehyde dehydrogenase / glutarate-semialdehyde dehydrogenase
VNDLAHHAERAAAAFARWRTTTIAQRAAQLQALASIVNRQAGDLARLIHAEVSKTMHGSAAELVKSADYCRWLAQHGERILAPRALSPSASLRYDPLGVVAGIMPWNFPAWQVFRFAAPALLAGNTVVVKHSPLVPRCADAVHALFAEAGFGDGVFACVAASADDAQRLIAHPAVRAVHFTGGDEAGRAVAAAAGAHLKKCVLELGGSDAFVVMPSADLDRTVPAAVTSRMRAGGQACTAAKRFIVHDAIAGAFEQRLIEAMQAVEPVPLVHASFAERLERQLRESVAAGARIRCGGERIDARTFAPMVVDVPHAELPLMQEETFGPVAPLLRVRDRDAAIDAANATRYGLSASIWTRDDADVAAFAAALHVGQLYVNQVVSSQFDVPFGGTKDSGFGRELGEAGVLELVNVKAVVTGS